MHSSAKRKNYIRKTMTNPLLLALIFFLSASTAKPKLVEQDAPSEAVTDIAGKAVEAGTKYYILPVFRGRGGGLTLEKIGNETCPLNVVQENFDTINGLPLTFWPLNPNDTVVRVGYDLNVQFEASTVCVTSTVWQLDFDESSEKFLITIGGVIGNPGVETLGNWFHIAKSGDDYVLGFCPGVCDFCRPVCGEFGIFHRNAQRILALLTPPPFRVKFKKVEA